MINVRELMNDSDFCSYYTVVRTTIKWEKGRQKPSTTTKLKYYGPVQPATADELQQIPEGDRSQEIFKFMCAPPKKIYITANKDDGTSENDGYVSDKIIYDGTLWKIIRVMNWRAHGYTRAFAYSIGEVSDNG